MFWILGMEEVAWSGYRALPCGVTRFVAEQLEHAEWAGFRFLDLVFPLFVFLSGVSMVYSLSGCIARDGTMAAARKIVIRSILLYALGLVYYGGISHGLEGVRWVGVLQRIAIGNLAGGLLFCFASQRLRAAATASLLLGYWIVMSWIPVPGGGAGDFAQGPEHNWANWIDFHFLPGHLWDRTHDPEGLLSTLPAIATCLLGTFAGEFLRSPRFPALARARILIFAGLGLALCGWLWHLQFPVIKKLWTSSYVLVAGGYSCMLLGTFYWIIDIKGWKRWATPFVWIGMNAITLYLIQNLVKIEWLVEALAGGPIAAMFGTGSKLWLALCALAVNILLARFLYRRNIFLRI
jgi:predicted acyltransferase